MLKKSSTLIAILLLSSTAFAGFEKSTITEGIETLTIDVPNTYQDINIMRVRVPGGWLVTIGNGSFFYPDEKHEWMPSASEDTRNTRFANPWKK